jgi:hypothetical protein
MSIQTAQTVDQHKSSSAAGGSALTLDEARAKLRRATGLSDFATMVKAFQGYSGPEIAGVSLP